MSRPVVLMAFALVAGIAVGDALFYERLIVPAWLHWATWGFSICLAAGFIVGYRYENRRADQLRYSVFPLLTVLLFFAVGLERYAWVAEGQQQEWALQGRPVNRGNPDEFDRMRWEWVNGGTKDAGFGAKAREAMMRKLREVGMEEQTLALVAAITLGDRSLLSRDTRSLFAEVGASHLLALSGLHLGILVGLFLTWMNGRLLRSRWRKVVGLSILLFIWMYAAVAGFPTSLVRASVMTSVFVVACLMNRYGDPLQQLLLTAILMLLWRPMWLFDVGAQLSFASVAGILLFYRPLYMWFFARWRYQMFWLERYWLMGPLTMVAVSLCAQVLTLPLVAHYFHQIPVYGALVSVVLIPLTMMFIYGAAGVMVLAWLWPAMAALLSVGLTWIVTAQLWVMTQVAQWPGAVIHDFWSRKADPQVVIYHNRRCPALHVIASPSESWLLTPEPDSVATGMFYIRRDFWQRRLTAEPMVLEGHRAIALKGRKGTALEKGFTAVMVNTGSGEAATCTATTKVDVLWVVRGFRGGSIGLLAEHYVPRLLVLDASLPRWQRHTLTSEARDRGWRVYDVAEQGALRLK